MEDFEAYITRLDRSTAIPASHTLTTRFLSSWLPIEWSRAADFSITWQLLVAQVVRKDLKWELMNTYGPIQSY